MARIFVVDDDADIRQLVTYALVDDGHEVSVARNGAEALEVLLKDSPDLVVLDIMMPGLDGFDVLDQLNQAELRKNLKVLILTAKGSERDWEQGFRLGADMYMTKPFDPEEVVEAVRELLAASNEELAARREQEFDRAHLLSQLESLFGPEL
jgi:two-component system, OmpR family, alkaline phosphatase synthesis response regulator PhoP